LGQSRKPISNERKKTQKNYKPDFFHAVNVRSILTLMNDVTRILQAVQQGDQAASDQLLPLVYNELRRLARSRMADEPSAQTLQPTALVHEAYVRLVDARNPQAWNNKGHFFAAAANAMRRILVENARRKNSLRRGGDRRKMDMDKIDFADPNNSDFLTALDTSLEQLSNENEIVAQVVSLRFFAGLSIEQTSEALEISVRTVNRHWAYAKAWLHSQLSDESSD
jgi:RNA polymerase sigma factor (TIGR02999 family)